MHVSYPPAQPVKQSSVAPVADMSVFWNLAARMQLCHVPAHFHRAIAVTSVLARTSTGTFGFMPFLHLLSAVLNNGLVPRAQARVVHTPEQHHIATLHLAEQQQQVSPLDMPQPHPVKRASLLQGICSPRPVQPCADAQEHQSTANSQVPFPPKLGGAEIRERFLQFFERHQHVRLPSSSLIPDDPTVLLTIAGMLQFKSIFMGQVGPGFRSLLLKIARSSTFSCTLVANTAGREEAQPRDNNTEMHSHK